ncbi:MAG: nucleotidyltransferase domain-containing protein, partial [Acidobacteriales bacterium]|nr:nucleotidyltransferase domain-containing protein [Terriglobales bacterium]
NQLSASGVWERHIGSARQLFLAKAHLHAFAGFANDQLKKLLGQRNQKVTRMDLVERFGYDTKFAMHALRLALECEELVQTAALSFPNPHKDTLIAVRNGEWKQEDVVQTAQRVLRECEQSIAQSPLPDEVDRDAVAELLARAHREHWQERGL